MIDPSRGYHCKIATRSHELRTIGIPVWTLFSISLARLSSRYHEFVSTHTILRRLQMAQAEGLAAAMAEVVEADAEPIDGVLTDREGPKEGECERCSPRFYFRLGAVVAVIVLLSIVIPVAITESGGFNDDSRDDPGLSKFVQPVSCDIAYPLEVGEDPIFCFSYGRCWAKLRKRLLSNKLDMPWKVRWFTVDSGSSSAPALNAIICEQVPQSVGETNLFAEVFSGNCTDRTCFPIDGRILSSYCRNFAWFVEPSTEYTIMVYDYSGSPKDGFNIRVEETDFVENLSCDTPLNITSSSDTVLENLESTFIRSPVSNHTTCDGVLTMNTS